MSDVRANAGVPVLAQFGGIATPSACAPIVVDSTTGFIYSWKTGDVIVASGMGGTVINASALTANALMVGAGANASAVLASLGTTATVLHGNASGAPTFGKVDLANDVSGALAIASLAAGAANTKLFTNAAASACEFATGLKVGTFTKDMTQASGNVSYTGVGFKPAAIVFCASGPDNNGLSVGTDNASSKGSVVAYGAGSYTSTTSFSIYMLNAAGTTLQDAFVASFDTDGFTLTWAKVGSPTGTGTVIYLALR